MKFWQYILSEEQSDIKKALGLDDPKDNEEYLKDIVMEWITLIDYAISIQKKKVLANSEDKIQLGILNDLLLKSRKWKDLFKKRWPKESDDNLSPVSSKPTQPPIGADSKMPVDLYNKVQGNDKDDSDDSEDSDKKKKK